MRILAWPASSRVSRNAYSSLLTEAVENGGAAEVVEFSPARALLRKWDVWHMHWPQHVFQTRSRLKLLVKIAAFAFLIGWTRVRGTKLVWTIHNLSAHDGIHRRFEFHFMSWLVRRLDGLIAPSERGAQLAAARFRGLSADRIAVIPLGHYLDAYPNTVSRQAARRALGLHDDATCVAFVGRIAPYKGVTELLHQFRLLDDPKVRLLVAGQPSSEPERRCIEAKAKDDSRVRLFLQWINDPDLQRFFGAADLVVFPYREILNSSSALLALSFRRPLLVPSLPALADLQERFGARWVRTYRGALTAEVLQRAISSPQPDEHEVEQRLRRDHDWSAIGTRTRSFYEELMTA